MSKQLDDIVFELGKSGAKATAGAAGAAVTSAVRNFDPSSVVRSMGRGSFFKNISLPEIPLTSSKLFHTGDNLKLLKNVSLDSLIPQDTAALLKGLSKQADDVAGKTGKQADDFATAFAKNDDVYALKNLANNTSLGKLKKISDDIGNLTKKNADLVGNKSLLKSSDEITENTAKASAKTSFKNTDEMTNSLKSSSGFAKKTDDVAEATTDAGKIQLKKADGVVDDLVEEADGKWTKLYKKMDKYNGVVSMAVFAGFMFSRHINGNAPWSTPEFEAAVGDPVEVGEIEQISYDLDMEEIVKRNVPEQKISEAQSKAITLAIIAASVAFLSA